MNCSYIDVHNQRFQEIYTFLPDILKNSKDFNELNFPSNTNIVVLESAITTELVYNSVLKTIVIENEELAYIFPLGIDFGIRNADSCVVEFNINMPYEDFLNIFRHNCVKYAENIVIKTKSENWFICSDFSSNLTYVILKNDTIFFTSFCDLFGVLSLGDFETVLERVVYEYSNDSNNIDLFKKNILPYVLKQ